MNRLFLALFLCFVSFFGNAQDGYDTDTEYKVYSEKGNHYLIKYYPYGKPYDIDNNGVIGQISLVDVYLIRRWFDMGIKVELVKIGRTFSNYYFKKDTPYMKQQIEFAKDDAKNYPKEWGVVPNKPKKL
jgi:hypothetical protein